MHQVQKLLAKICSGIGTPAAKGIKTLAERGEWAHLQRMSLGPPDTYASPEAYRNDLFVTEFVRKLAIPGNARACKEKAKETFYQAEAQCLRTNAFLLHLRHGYLSTCDLGVSEFITRWRAVAKSVLGPLPERLYPRYSPGSTLSDVGSQITIPDKMSSANTTYPHSGAVTDHTIAGTELDSLRLPRVRRGNRFFTVPKTGLTDRACCVEAKLNVVSQLDAGLHIRSRYNRYYGVVLQDMQPYHRLAAKIASEGAPYVTIDLSNASDTVAKELVKAILPTPWYELLESLRARFTYVDGKNVYLQKFSSMGNGFTFELETLLFRTLLEACGASRDDALVYGDDIIVHASLSRTVLSALRVFGFTPNAKKTFCEGPFRESCGGDYWKGYDVRALYLKEIPDEPQKWVTLHNQLVRWDTQDRLLAARRYCVDQIPTNWRLWGPDDGTDRWLNTEEPEPVCHRPIPRSRTERRWVQKGSNSPVPGFWGHVPIAASITVSHKWFKPHVVIASALLGVGERVALRGKIDGYRKVFVPIWGISDKETNCRYPRLII